MPTWRVDIRMSIVLDTSDIEAFPFFEDNFDDVNDGKGTNHSILKERAWLDVNLIRQNLDQLLQWDVKTRTPHPPIWKLRGTEVKDGTDGEFVSPNEFRSSAVALANADVGRYIFIPPGQAGKLNARGHYLITARNGPNSVDIDGIIPAVHTGLTFSIHEPTEVIAVLVSDP